MLPSHKHYIHITIIILTDLLNRKILVGFTRFEHWKILLFNILELDNFKRILFDNFITLIFRVTLQYYYYRKHH